MNNTPSEQAESTPKKEVGTERRSFMHKLSGWTMMVGLVGGYGAFAATAGRFLMPARPPRKQWVFVARVDDLKVGSSVPYKMPDGAKIAIARQGSGREASDFLALSSICPHLGCQVHWEGKNKRFFCPCHNGAFDPTGKAIAGPPKDGGQELASFPLQVKNGLLYIEVRVEGGITKRAELDDCPAPTGPGQDPCLFEQPHREV
ncbi:MAG: Rieske Fe-S protein [Planctomycetota bacterium]|jgi:Rieske Fe-S protein